MNIKKLFEMQEVLDERIIKEHGLKGLNLIENKLLALRVEISELANETRCFKHWSKKGPSPKKVILEEYVDGFHFILSLGLDYGIKPDTSSISRVRVRFNGDELITQFNMLYKYISDLSVCSKRDIDLYYRAVLSNFLGLGEMLGFTEEEIEQAYMIKNKVNHQRQDSGY